MASRNRLLELMRYTLRLLELQEQRTRNNAAVDPELENKLRSAIHHTIRELTALTPRRSDTAAASTRVLQFPRQTKQ